MDKRTAAHEGGSSRRRKMKDEDKNEHRLNQHRRREIHRVREWEGIN